MNDYPKWPHLENLERVLKDIPDYLTRPDTEYSVTEKVHGFNARFGRAEDGTPWAGSRNQTVVEGYDWSGHMNDLQGFVAYAHDVMFGPVGDVGAHGDIQPGETFFGEWAGKGIQKGIDYGDKAFYLFGVHFSDGDNSRFKAPDEVLEEAEYHGLNTVPELHVPWDLTVAYLDGLRREKSLISEDPREGIVIVPDPPILDQYGHVVIAKFKHPNFAETAHARKDKPAPLVLENVQAFVDEYVTEERLNHVLQQVADCGVLDPIDPLDVRYTGDVLRYMYQDIVREGRADFEALSEADQKAVGKYSAKATKPLLEAARLRSMEESAA